MASETMGEGEIERLARWCDDRAARQEEWLAYAKPPAHHPDTVRARSEAEHFRAIASIVRNSAPEYRVTTTPEPAYLAVGIAGVQTFAEHTEAVEWAQREAADIDYAMPGGEPAQIEVYTTIAMEIVRAATSEEAGT